MNVVRPDFINDLTSPSLERLSPEPTRFKQEVDVEEGTVIFRIRDEMGDLVASSLPQEMEGNVIYPPFLSGRAKEWITAHPSLAVHVPRHRGEEKVQDIIHKTATNSAEKLEKKQHIDECEKDRAVHNLRVAINSALRKALEDLDISKIIYVAPDVKRSPREVAMAVEEVSKAILAGEIKQDHAAVALFWKLGAYKDEEIQKQGRKDEGKSIGDFRLSITRKTLPINSFADLNKFNLNALAEDLHASLVWAREFLDEKIKERLKPLITKEVARGELKGPVRYPSFNETQRGEDLFTLLKVLFAKDSTPENANDAQILTNFALVHWIFERRKKELKHVQQIDEIDDQIEQEMFEMDESGKVNKEILTHSQKILAYDEDNKRFVETEGFYEERCRVLKVSEEYADIPEELRLVFLDRMGDKSSKSMVIKHFNPGRNSRDPDKMPDEVRTRLVAWNVTSQDFEKNPRLKQMYTEQMQEMGAKLGLNPCEVENEMNHEHFPKMTLSGRNKEGINVEIQLIPIDTHQFAEADESWFGHKKLEEMRDLEMLLVPIPYSVSPVSHKVGQKRLKYIKEKRNDCRSARKAFLAERMAD